MRRSKHSAAYRAHLRSPEWAAIRKAALIRAGHRCAFCGRSLAALRSRGRHLEVHHNTYENMPHERPEDLTVLCAGTPGSCHTVADRQRRAATRGRRPKRRKKRGGELRRLKRTAITVGAVYGALALAPHVLPLLK
jgi:5-methylcytosine-specific restriction endonuclease McrA